MEKYAKLMKGLEMCAGPECCKDGCPYYGETRGSMTCRARLLKDASIAIMNERSSAVAALQDREAAEKENEVLRERCREKDKLCQECEGLKEYALALEKEGQEARAKGDKLNQEITCIIKQREQAEADLHAVKEQNKNLRAERDSLANENKIMRERCQVQQDEINALLHKTDRPPVCSDDQLRNEYKRGYLDAMEYCFRELCKQAGGGRRHE